jgi:phosphate transport system protein
MQTDVFEQELYRLCNELVALGAIVEKGIVESVEALHRRAKRDDNGKGVSTQSLITLDHQITKRRFAIEMDCVALIITHQPLDAELPAIASLMEIATELEHIGRYVTDIASAQFMIAQPDPSLLRLIVPIREMARQTANMLQQAMQAFEHGDVAWARRVHAQDAQLDRLFQDAYGCVMDLMRGKSRTVVKQARYLTQIARNLERAADRVTNICEWVAYAVNGSMDEFDRETIGVNWEETA